MTDPILGRATPVHFAMVELAGWGLRDTETAVKQWDLEASWGFAAGERARELMHLGRAELITITGQDFGFVLADWADFLTAAKATDSDGDFGYGHPYSASLVHQIVEEGLARPDRRSLERAANSGWGAYWDRFFEGLPIPLQDRLTNPDLAVRNVKTPRSRA